MDRGAWRATVHGLARIGRDLAAKPLPYRYASSTLYYVQATIDQGGMRIKSELLSPLPSLKLRRIYLHNSRHVGEVCIGI